MNLSKKLIFTAVLSATLAVNPSLYAKDTTDTTDTAAKPAKITGAETNSLGTIAAIDANEIFMGILATNKKTSSSVNDFGKMMVDMHGNNLTQILEMANTNHINSLKTSSAEQIHNKGMKEMMKLGGLSGNEFDKAYIDAMVTGHQDALNLIDQKLMKTAKSEEVKKFLTDTRAVVVQHLTDAKKIQDSMKS